MSENQENSTQTESQPRLHEELEAARLLIQQLRLSGEASDGEEDDDLVADMVEGETSLLEAIGKILEGIRETDASIVGLKDYEEKARDRRRRLEAKNDRHKWLVENALATAKRSKYEHPLCTISTAKSPPKVEIVEEHLIPGAYWKQGDPTLDKRLLLADLKEKKALGEEIPGAKLGGGEQSHRWRWS